MLDAGHVVESGRASDVFLHPQHATTRRFVQEAENIDENDQYADFANVPGRIVRLTFVGERTYEPFLTRVARNTGMDFNILSGRIDRIKDTPYGQLILSLVGGNQDDAIAQLVEHGVTVEELRA
nr:NIL domain-containing protein [Laribacter hongkongensis]